MSFGKILIANRGEIACRIIATARALGYRTVAVFSDADRGARHVRLAHEAVRIGPAPAAESYLDIGALMAAAKLSGADAIHPGYGFVSENPAFAEACVQSGLVFIGPDAESIRTMGNKIAAKQLMRNAGIPCLPGWHGADAAPEEWAAQARSIGFPIMIKAAAGGGGRGMRVVGEESQLAAALETARLETLRAFGSGELLLEKAIPDARHVEIQVLADRHGNVIHLGERECSIQRRYQKVIEEAPSPVLTPELRAEMGKAAVLAARRINYRGAGTVEFLLDASGRFYFLEMNTRLQVEHAVTEAITGLDLVALQIEIAAGERLPLTQDQVCWSGHAIEARVYAEDAGFLPSTGRIFAWQKARGAGIRIDHGLSCGQAVTAFYDPLLAKVIGHGRNREEARRRLLSALRDTVLLGVETNRGFLCWALTHPVFMKSDATTAFIETHFRAEKQNFSFDVTMVALAAVLLSESRSPGRPLTQWSSTGNATWPLRLTADDVEFATEVTPQGAGRFAVALGAATIEIEVVDQHDNELRFRVGALERVAHFSREAELLYLDVQGAIATFREPPHQRQGLTRDSADNELRAPMTGVVAAVFARQGDYLRHGQAVLIIEAMKMQHEITADGDGIVAHLHVKAGDQVAARQLLANIANQNSETGIGNQNPETGNQNLEDGA